MRRVWKTADGKVWATREERDEAIIADRLRRGLACEGIQIDEDGSVLRPGFPRAKSSPRATRKPPRR